MVSWNLISDVCETTKFVLAILHWKQGLLGDKKNTFLPQMTCTGDRNTGSNNIRNVRKQTDLNGWKWSFWDSRNVFFFYWMQSKRFSLGMVTWLNIDGFVLSTGLNYYGLFIVAMNCFFENCLRFNTFWSRLRQLYMLQPSPPTPWTLSQTKNFRLFQTERLCRRQFQIWWKWKKVLQTGRKKLLEKEKLLVLSNFFFFCSVFKRLVLQSRENQGLFGKGFIKTER